MGSQMNTTGLKAFTAGEAIPVYRRVKLSGTSVVLCGTYDKGIGYAEHAAASGAIVTVRLDGVPGTRKVVCVGAVAAGAAVYQTGAAGKVDDAWATGGPQVGIALEAGDGDDSIIEILPEFGGQELLFSILADSSNLTAAVAAAFSNGSFSIAAGQIREGDIYDIDATVALPTTDGSDEFTGSLLFGTETIVATAHPDAVNADTAKIHARVHIRVAGASGKLYAEGESMNDALAAGLALPFADTAERSEDLSVACPVSILGVWSDATGNVAVLKQFSVRRTRK